MIRVILTSGQNAYGYDVTGWENTSARDCYYGSLLEEDLCERINCGDILMYFDCSESAEEWCELNNYIYELVEYDDN